MSRDPGEGTGRGEAGLLVSVLRALGEDLPLLLIGLNAVGLAWTTWWDLGPESAAVGWSWVFPFLLLAVVVGATWSRRPRAARVAGAVLLAGPLLLLAGGALAPGRPPVPREELRRLFEWDVIGVTALLALHMAWRRPALLALFFGPVLLYGVGLENAGILLGYFEESGARWHVPLLPAPVATMCGWVVALYFAIHATWRLQEAWPALRRRPLLAASTAAAAALLIDVQVDPVALEIGVWRWHPALAPGLFGVPTVNWVAWAAAVVPFGVVFFGRERRHGLAPGEIAAWPHVRHLLLALVPVGLAAFALFLLVMLALEGGTGGPTFDVLRSTLG